MSEFHIAPSVLEDIVSRSLCGKKEIRIHFPLPLARSNPIDVALTGKDCMVTIQLDAQMGESLPNLATEVRTMIAESLKRMAGLHATAVDVIFASVFSIES